MEGHFSRKALQASDLSFVNKRLTEFTKIRISPNFDVQAVGFRPNYAQLGDSSHNSLIQKAAVFTSGIRDPYL